MLAWCSCLYWAATMAVIVRSWMAWIFSMNRAAFFIGRRLIWRFLDLDWFDVVPVVHEECRRSRLSSSMSAWSREYLIPAASCLHVNNGQSSIEDEDHACPLRSAALF
jgi:hypothetical protein